MVGTDWQFNDPVQDTRAGRDYDAAWGALQAMRNNVSIQQAIAATNLAREYPDASPDAVAAVAAGGWASDDPSLSRIFAADNRQQGMLQQGISSVLGAVTRPTLAFFEDVYRQAVSRPLNMGTRMLQGESAYDAFVGSGVGLAGQIARAEALDEQWTLGQGLIPGMHPDPLMAPGASEVLRGAMEQGASPQEAMSYTEEWVLEKYGRDVMNRSREASETTMLHKTKDGTTTSYHATPGRVLFSPFTEWIAPETLPHVMFTGSLDITGQIFLDPNNWTFEEMTRIARARRTAAPSLADGTPMDGSAQDLGAIRIDRPEPGRETAEGLVFHGGGPLDPDDPVLRHGGMTTDVNEALSYMDTGGGIWTDTSDVENVIHVISSDDLPPHMKTLLDERGIVNQYWETPALAEAFPEHDVEDLVRFRDEWMEASRTMESSRTELRTMLDDDEMAEIYGAIRNRMSEDPDAGMADFQEIREIYDVHWRMHDSEEADRIVGLIDSWYEAEDVIKHHELFGEEARHAYRDQPAWNAIYHHLDDPQAVFGTEPFSPRVSATYTADEMAEMQEWGMVFPDRKQFEAYKGVLDDRLEQGMAKVRGKWRITPSTFEEWLGQRRGQRFVQWIQQASFDEIRPIMRGMDTDDIWKLHDTEDLTEIEGLLKRWYGTNRSGYVVPKAPNRLGQRMKGAWSATDPELGAGSGWSNQPRNRMRMSAYGRRLNAQMGNNTIDPLDFDGTFDTVVSWADTLGVEGDELNRVLRLATEMEKAGTRAAARPVVEAMYTWLTNDLERLGYSASEIKAILAKWDEGVRKQTSYGSNAAGSRLPLQHGRNTEIKTRYGTIVFRDDQPILDTQLASRSVYMPDIRSVRRATSRLRKMTDTVRARRGLELPGLSTSKGQHMVDQALMGWRNMALLRPGWTMRVIPDELARFWAYGYSDVGENPLAILMMSMGERGDVVLPNGESMNAMFDASGLGADNGLLRTHGDRPGRAGTTVRNTHWLEAPAYRQLSDGRIELTPEGAKGIARNILQLHGSELQQLLAEHQDIYDVVRYLRETQDGRRILASISGSVEDDTFLGLATKFRHPDSQAALEHVLQTIEGQRHQYTGGEWIARNPEQTGWVDMYGNDIDLYDGREWTREALVDALVSRGVTGPRGGRPTGTLKQLRGMMLEADGRPADLLSRPSNETVIVTRRGDPALLEMMRTGRMQDTPNINNARSRTVREMFRQRIPDAPRSDYVYVNVAGKEMKAAKRIGEGNIEAYTDLDQAARKLQPGEAIYPVLKENLDPEDFVGTGRQTKITITDGALPESRIGYDDLDSNTKLMLDEGSYQYIGEDMEVADFRALEERLGYAYNQDYPPPTTIRYPEQAYIDIQDEKNLIEDAFKTLGRDPSMFLARKPFATLRTWDVIAQSYIYAPSNVRAELLQMAQDAGMGRRFERFIEKHLKRAGMKKPLAQEALTRDEIVGQAFNTALEDTKDLFYDLSKGGAWQDAARIVFPFADAWWEVLTRWAGLMNPVRQGGRPVRMARRISQATVGAERSGYFDTNQAGERVFSMPAAGTIFNQFYGGNQGVGFETQASIDQLLFVDFANPQQALKPGSSPQAQLLASTVRPLMPPDIRDKYDEAVYGEFGAPNIRDVGDIVKSFLPTYGRRTLARTLDGEFDEKFASMQVRVVNGLAQQEEYADLATNPDTARRAWKEAQEITGWLGTVDIFTSFISPAQPQNVASMVLYDEQGDGHFKSLSAMAADWALLRSIYGEDEGMQYFIEMYGVDPLKFAPTTWSTTPRPVTKEAELFRQEHEGMTDALPYTLMAWLPPDEGEFFVEAWSRQKAEGARQQLNGKTATMYIGHINGSHRLRKLREERDQLLADAEARYGGRDNDSYRYIRDEVVKPWYNNEHADIYLQYWAYGPNSSVTGLQARPSFKEVLGELRQAAEPGTDAYDWASRTNPEVHDFVSYSMGLWEQAEQLSIDAGYQLTWWSASTSETNAAAALRGAFQQNINNYMNTRMSPEGREQAVWLTETVFQPLLQGFDWENPIVIAPAKPRTADTEFVGRLSEEI